MLVWDTTFKEALLSLDSIPRLIISSWGARDITFYPSTSFVSRASGGSAIKSDMTMSVHGKHTTTNLQKSNSHFAKTHQKPPWVFLQCNVSLILIIVVQKKMNWLQNLLSFSRSKLYTQISLSAIKVLLVWWKGSNLYSLKKTDILFGRALDDFKFMLFEKQVVLSVMAKSQQKWQILMVYFLPWKI